MQRLSFREIDFLAQLNTVREQTKGNAISYVVTMTLELELCYILRVKKIPNYSNTYYLKKKQFQMLLKNLLERVRMCKIRFEFDNDNTVTSE